MGKGLAAFGLSVVSFFLFFLFGEGVGLGAAFIALTVYFFICQFLLSRGHPNGYREDLPIMAALDSIPLLMTVVMIAVEKPQVIFSQAPPILGSSLGGTYAGAVVASFTARRRPQP